MADEPDRSQEELEQERLQREAEELASFRRRADWWSEHYGGADPDQVSQAAQASVPADEETPESPSSAEGGTTGPDD